MDSVNLYKTPKEAKENGHKFYYSGLPCKHGNVEKRYINGNCSCEPCKKSRNKSVSGWIQNNPDKQKSIRNKNYLKHKDIINQKNNEWKKNNLSKVAKYNAKRHSAKLNSVPKWYGELDELVMQEAYDLSNLRNKMLGFEWNVDHMYPLQAKTVCGLHCGANIQVIPKTLNMQKRNSLIFTDYYEWIQKA
jgi:hypothetical protein